MSPFWTTRNSRLKNVHQDLAFTKQRELRLEPGFHRGGRWENTLNAPGSSPVSGKTINPGDTVDVSIDLKSPATVGTYRTNFKLRSDGGEIFGIGNKNNPFWAQINVVVATGLTFDFNNRASQAKWTSGTGTTTEHELTFGGDVADPNGTATIAMALYWKTRAPRGRFC